MIKVYTEVLGFNNLMYRYMSLPNSLSLADLAYYTLASYLSEEYADFVIESNGIPFACPNCEDEQFNKLPCASSIQPDFKEGDTFKMVYDLEEPFEIEIQVEKVDDIEEDANVVNGRGFAIWDGFKEFQDYYYQSMELFKEYVKDYNPNDGKIALKISHILRVTQKSRELAEELNLNEEDTDLAELIGLLHDIGRFEQVRIYNTFYDKDSINHGEYGVKILFEDGLIRKFIKDDSYDEIIKKAILNHNRPRIEEGLSKRELMHAKIIRDADKLDIYYVLTTIFPPL